MTVLVRSCGLCNKPVTEDDHYKELDCTFPKCPGDCYHDDCMDPYLRKRGRQGTEQRTRYPCPATLANGAACPGTIRGTHNRVPANQKKKEQAREAATGVNRQPPSPPPAKPLPAATAAAKPSGGLKILVKAAVPPIRAKAAAPPQPVRNAWAASPWSGIPAAARAAAGDGTAPAGPGSPSTTPQVNAKASRLLAPEPVVRQRTIPGWSGPDPGQAKAGKATLEEQRALAAALKAEAREAAGKAAKQAAAAAGSAAAAGAKAAAGGAAAAPNGACPPAKPAATNGSGGGSPGAAAAAGASSADPGSTPSAAAAITAAAGGSSALATPAPGATPVLGADGGVSDGSSGGGGGGDDAVPSAAGAPGSLHLDAAAFEAAFRRALGHSHALAGGGGGAAAELDGAGADSGASTAHFGLIPTDSLDGGAEPEPDPIVAYDPVYAAEDGITLLVQDVYGNFMRVEDVYGSGAEFAEFPDECGNLVYGVAIRQSQSAVLAAAAAAGDAAAAGVAVGAALPTAGSTAAGLPLLTTLTAVSSKDLLSDQGLPSAAALLLPHGADAVGGATPADLAASTAKLGFPLPPSAAQAEAEAADEDEDELQDLLALCLGVSG